MHLSRLFIASFAFSILVAAQTTAPFGSFPQNSKPSTDDQKRTIRVGVAVMANRSGHSASPGWERDQLVRELQRSRTDRKSPVVIEAVSLEESSQEEASREATQKNCNYLVLTTMVDPRGGSGIPGGRDGGMPAPVILGNERPGHILAIDYAILDVSDMRTLASGTSTASVEEHNSTRAADEAMRMTAHRVVSELRKNRPPSID